MQKRSALKLDRSDLANIDNLMSAFNLVGADHGEKPWERDRKVSNPFVSFGRIKGNDFTWDDAVDAVAIIRRRRDEIHARANDPVFLEPKLQEVFSTGVKSNADHAVRMAEGFLSDLRDDITDHR
jgi:hypothetical protein